MKLKEWILNRQYLNTIVYSVTPSLLILALVRIPRIDLETQEGWAELLTWQTGIEFVLSVGAICWAMVRLITFFVSWRKAEKLESQVDDPHVILHIGPPGSGKSAFMRMITYICARRHWRELKYRYITESRKREQYTEMVESGDAVQVAEGKDKLAQLDYLEKSYVAMKSREGDQIPLLYSSIPIREKGRMSYVLKAEHITQKELLPWGAVLFCDEVGVLFGSDVSKSLPPEVAEWFRYPRHFGE
ncbi:MAG: hypothetical protein ACI4U2_04060, partial [Christensenellaceae bacterium]